MEIIILAETVSKESWQEGIKAFFKQYAIKDNLTLDERDEYYRNGFRRIIEFATPAIMMRRRVDVLSDDTISPREWESVDCYGSIEDAANDFGETDYFNAISKHEVHTNAIRRWKHTNELYAEHRELLQKGNGLHDVYQDKYISELKTERLWKAANEGTSNVNKQNAIAIIRERIRKEYEEERAAINARLEEINQEMKGL